MLEQVAPEKIRAQELDDLPLCNGHTVSCCGKDFCWIRLQLKNVAQKSSTITHFFPGTRSGVVIRMWEGFLLETVAPEEIRAQELDLIHICSGQRYAVCRIQLWR